MPTVVHIIDELKVGGAQTHLVTMIRGALDAFPHVDHRVVSLFGDGPIHSQLVELRVPVDALDLRPLAQQDRYLQAAGVLKELFQSHSPDLVEAHLTYSRLIGLFAAWRAGVPRRIAFEHGDLYLSAPKFRLGHFVGQHFAQRVIVVSEALAGWARQTYRLSPRRTTVLHNCVDVDRLRPFGQTAPADLGVSPTSTVFATVGTLGRGVNKRVDVCIRAIETARAQGADVCLVVCGDGPLKEDLKALAADLGVSSSVQFLGLRSDVPAVLAASDAFCLATEFEPFGIVGIEALAMALPAIVPNQGGMVEAIDDGKTGLIYPALDHRALARAMRWLHEHPHERQRMGLAARRSAEERFSVRQYIHRLYDLYGLAGASNQDRVT